MVMSCRKEECKWQRTLRDFYLCVYRKVNNKNVILDENGKCKRFERKDLVDDKMKTKEIADELLEIFYEHYIKDEPIDAITLDMETPYKGKNIDLAIKYLKDKKWINITHKFESRGGIQEFEFFWVLPDGIDYVENKNQD